MCMGVVVVVGEVVAAGGCGLLLMRVGGGWGCGRFRVRPECLRRGFLAHQVPRGQVKGLELGEAGQH